MICLPYYPYFRFSVFASVEVCSFSFFEHLGLGFGAKTQAVFRGIWCGFQFSLFGFPLSLQQLRCLKHVCTKTLQPKEFLNNRLMHMLLVIIREFKILLQ